MEKEQARDAALNRQTPRMAEPFVPDDFEVPPDLDLPGMRLEPLCPRHNEIDHAAWMSSIEHIHATPGFEPGGEDPWPVPMTLEQNLVDLQGHEADFQARRGFTYAVMDIATDDEIGCVYIYPSDDHDARVQSWVRVSRSEVDEPLWRAVSDWLRRDWPFERVDYR